MEIKKLKFDCSDKNQTSALLNCMLVNARSLTKTTIDNLLNILFKDEDIDVCCITETWLKSTDQAVLADIKFRGYEIVNSPRPTNKRGGGIAFMCKNNYKFAEIKTTKYVYFELQEVLFSCKTSCIRFSTIYRTGQLTANEKSKFLEELHDYLDSLLFKDGINIIWGDFNISKDQIINKTFYILFMDLLESKGYKLIIDKPTHQKNGVLDLVFVPTNYHFNNVTIFSPDSGIEISDHYPIKLQLPLEPKRKNLSTKIKFRDLNNIDRHLSI